MTKLNPLPRAVATAAVAAGACLLAAPCSPALAAGSKAAASPATGQGENAPLDLGPVTSGTHSSGSGASIVRTIVGLAIVIAVIWGLSWILRQVKAGRDPRTSSAGLTSLAALTLSTGRSVHLVRAGNDYLLLGSAEQGVVPIHRYTEEEAREAGLMDVVEAGYSGQRPRRTLLRPPDGAGPARSGGGRAVATQRHSPHDPMDMPSPGPGASLLDRLRELTVRR